MHRDVEASSSAYFFRLAQLLRPELIGARMDGAARQLSQAFGPVAAMWRALHDWVTLHQQAVGVSTIRDHPHWTRIGFALSQALVRRSDRMRLTSFLAAMDMSSRGVPQAEALLQWLRIWLSRSRGLSDQFCRALDDPRNNEFIGGYLHRLASSWDGVVVTAEGRCRLEFRFVVDLQSPDTRWVVPLVPGVDDAVLLVEGGEAVHLKRPADGAFYDMEGPLPKVAVALASGLKAVGAGCVAVADSRPVIGMREDASAGAWMSTPTIQPFEEHLLVAEPSVRAELEETLHLAAAPGWRPLQRLSEQLLPGRLLYWGVRFNDPDSFDNAARRLGPSLVQGLRPDPGSRPRLALGLPLACGVGKAYYLAGGEPDLILPVGTEPRQVEASLDGSVQSPPFRATGFPVELRRLGPLVEGRHELVVEGDKLEFFTTERLPPTWVTNQPSLAWQASRDYASLSDGDPDPADISGARVPVARPEPDPALVRLGGEAWLIDRYGRARRLADQAPSSSHLARAVPAPYYRAVVPEPDDAWVVEFRHGRPQAPRQLRWQEPYFSQLDSDSVALWRRLDQAGGDHRLWELYLKAWRAYAG
jgi:hypothetical protein